MMKVTDYVIGGFVGWLLCMLSVAIFLYQRGDLVPLLRMLF